jgi:hypothetical protein
MRNRILVGLAAAIMALTIGFTSNAIGGQRGYRSGVSDGHRLGMASGIAFEAEMIETSPDYSNGDPSAYALHVASDAVGAGAVRDFRPHADGTYDALDTEAGKRFMGHYTFAVYEDANGHPYVSILAKGTHPQIYGLDFGTQVFMTGTLGSGKARLHDLFHNVVSTIALSSLGPEPAKNPEW